MQPDFDQFKLAVDNATDHIVITDHEGKIIYANKAAQDLTGYTFEEMKGQTPGLWGRQMSSDFYKLLWRTIKVEKQKFTGELTNKNKKGELYAAEAKINPVLDENGEIKYYIGIERDIGRQTETTKEKNMYEFIFKSSPHPVAISSMDGTLMNMNNSFNELFNLSLNTTGNTNFLNLIHHEDRETIRRQLLDLESVTQEIHANPRYRKPGDQYMEMQTHISKGNDGYLFLTLTLSKKEEIH